MFLSPCLSQFVCDQMCQNSSSSAKRLSKVVLAYRSYSFPSPLSISSPTSLSRALIVSTMWPNFLLSQLFKSPVIILNPFFISSWECPSTYCYTVWTLSPHSPFWSQYNLKRKGRLFLLFLGAVVGLLMYKKIRTWPKYEENTCSIYVKGKEYSHAIFPKHRSCPRCIFTISSIIPCVLPSTASQVLQVCIQCSFPTPLDLVWISLTFATFFAANNISLKYQNISIEAIVHAPTTS